MHGNAATQISWYKSVTDRCQLSSGCALKSVTVFAFLQRPHLPWMILVSNWAWQQWQGKPVPGKSGTPWKDGSGSELSSGPLESKTSHLCFLPPSPSSTHPSFLPSSLPSFLFPFLPFFFPTSYPSFFSPLLPSFPWGQTCIMVSWLQAPLVPAQFSSRMLPLIKYFAWILILTCHLHLHAGVRFLREPSWVSIISSV